MHNIKFTLHFNILSLYCSCERTICTPTIIFGAAIQIDFEGKQIGIANEFNYIRDSLINFTELTRENNFLCCNCANTVITIMVLENLTALYNLSGSEACINYLSSLDYIHWK